MNQWINLKEFGDQRGKLVSIENNHLPFKMERLFYTPFVYKKEAIFYEFMM